MSSYQVIARKWRPQNFDEVVFQDHVSKTLRNSIENGRISHAYLFSGPRGVGKTTMARILAKALNCVEGPTPNPCGVCDNCVEVKSGTAFDVIEIDGASNRGIEDIRELRENVNFAPVKSKYKVYIIDEVHMLTKEAFNALLKTLEEPPAHVVFVLATTEMHQVPETILSRCQKFFFKKIPIDPVVEHLKNIVTKEGYTISAKALYPIARASEGSMRDAQSLLDQVIAFSDSDERAGIEIGEEDALAILGIVPVESYIKQLRNIAGLDAAAAMEEVDKVVSIGVDIPRYIAGFIDILRSLRLVKNGISLQELLGLSPEEIALVKEIADSYFDEEIGPLFRILNDVQRDLRFSNNERVNLEMALLDMIAFKRAPSLASILSKLQDPSLAIKSPSNIARQAGGAGEAQKKNLIEPKPEPKPVPVPEPKKEEPASSKEPSSFGDYDVAALWADFLGSIRDEKQFLYNILKPTSAKLKGNSLLIEYPGDADNSYYSRMLDKNKELITTGMSQRLDRNITVEVGNRPEGAEGPAPAKAGPEEYFPVSNNNAPEEPLAGNSAPPPEAEPLKSPEVDELDQGNPTVEKIKTAFHGQVVDKK
ncbi:MAG: DNA polymerase III subunit gamma/tau [bacterium]|nr:DNA polymerase III subunit gamma/tau [bacterium]